MKASFYLGKGVILFFLFFFFSCLDTDKKSASSSLGKGQAEYHWRLVTTWPVGFPILSDAMLKFAARVHELTQGQVNIKVYGGGELLPPLEAFGAVAEGSVEIAHSASYYWAGKCAAAPFFGAVPFGMNTQQLTTWLVAGGGYELWKKVYDRFGVIPFLGGNTGVQMGGFFNREINSAADFKGLKMRIPGLGGKILEKAGAAAMVVPGSEIYTSLERGVIDAAEWIGPVHDHKMGLDRIAKYYYTPGWHEVGTQFEFIMNKKTYESLPRRIQAAIEAAAFEMHTWILAEFEKLNREALQEMIKAKVNIREFNQQTLDQLRKYADEALQEVADSDPEAKEVYDSYKKFQMAQLPWSAISEKIYYEKIAPKK